MTFLDLVAGGLQHPPAEVKLAVEQVPLAVVHVKNPAVEIDNRN